MFTIRGADRGNRLPELLQESPCPLNDDWFKELREPLARIRRPMGVGIWMQTMASSVTTGSIQMATLGKTRPVVWI